MKLRSSSQWIDGVPGFGLRGRGWEIARCVLGGIVLCFAILYVVTPNSHAPPTSQLAPRFGEPDDRWWTAAAALWFVGGCAVVLLAVAVVYWALYVFFLRSPAVLWSRCQSVGWIAVCAFLLLFCVWPLAANIRRANGGGQREEVARQYHAERYEAARRLFTDVWALWAENQRSPVRFVETQRLEETGHPESFPIIIDSLDLLARRTKGWTRCAGALIEDSQRMDPRQLQALNEWANANLARWSEDPRGPGDAAAAEFGRALLNPKAPATPLVAYLDPTRTGALEPRLGDTIPIWLPDTPMDTFQNLLQKTKTENDKFLESMHTLRSEGLTTVADLLEQAAPARTLHFQRQPHPLQILAGNADDRAALLANPTISLCDAFGTWSYDYERGTLKVWSVAYGGAGDKDSLIHNLCLDIIAQRGQMFREMMTLCELLRRNDKVSPKTVTLSKDLPSIFSGTFSLPEERLYGVDLTRLIMVTNYGVDLSRFKAVLAGWEQPSELWPGQLASALDALPRLSGDDSEVVDHVAALGKAFDAWREQAMNVRVLTSHLRRYAEEHRNDPGFVGIERAVRRGADDLDAETLVRPSLTDLPHGVGEGGYIDAADFEIIVRCGYDKLGMNEHATILSYPDNRANAVRDPSDDGSLGAHFKAALRQWILLHEAEERLKPNYTETAVLKFAEIVQKGLSEFLTSIMKQVISEHARADGDAKFGASVGATGLPFALMEWWAVRKPEYKGLIPKTLIGVAVEPPADPVPDVSTPAPTAEVIKTTSLNHQKVWSDTIQLLINTFEVNGDQSNGAERKRTLGVCAAFWGLRNPGNKPGRNPFEELALPDSIPKMSLTEITLELSMVSKKIVDLGEFQKQARIESTAEAIHLLRSQQVERWQIRTGDPDKLRVLNQELDKPFQPSPR